MWSMQVGRQRHAVTCRSSRHTIKRIISNHRGLRLVAHCKATQPLAVAAREHTSYDALWSAFASKVQGEWEGVTVTFNAEGVAQTLPERYVPGAYREWGVELYDWQSQSSCLLTQGSDNAGRGLRNIFKRLMPTVGCEADAIAYVEEADDVWKADGGSSVKSVTPAGSYVAAPAHLSGKVKLEACLAAPESSGPQSRLRAVLTLMQHWESKQWQVAFVDLSREVHEGPFNGGIQLSGCAGGGKPFAKELVTSAQQLAGNWSMTEAYRYSRSDATTGADFQLVDAGQGSSVSSLQNSTPILLPLGVWVSCSATKSDVRVEVGVLRGDAERDIAVCTFTDARLTEVVLASEVKQA